MYDYTYVYVYNICICKLIHIYIYINIGMMITEHALHAVLPGSSVPRRCGPTRWWTLRWQVAQLERLSKAGTQRQEQGGGEVQTPLEA